MADAAPDWYKPPGSKPAAPDWYKPPLAPAQPAAKPEVHSAIRDVWDMITAPDEAVKSMASSMVAKPISDVAGLGALMKEIISPTPGGGDPLGFKQDVQRRLTYEPKTAAGQAVNQYNPLALAGRGVDFLGGQAQQLIAPPGSGAGRQALGAGVHEAMNQAPGFVGVKGGKAMADAAGGAMRSGAERLMTSALKPTIKAHESGKAARAVGTMLDSGLLVNQKSAMKMNSEIKNLTDKVSNLVANNPAIIDKHAVSGRLIPVVEKYERQTSTSSDLAAIQKAYDEFMNHPLITGNDIPIKLAQEMKQGNSRKLGEKSYGPGIPGMAAERDAIKGLTRGLKEEIEGQIPDVQPLNARARELINALSISERRVMMEANRNLIGLGILTTNPLKFAEWMADRSGTFKSLIAQMLNKSSKGAKASGKLAPLGGVTTTQSANALPPPPEQDQ